MKLCKQSPIFALLIAFPLLIVGCGEPNQSTIAGDGGADVQQSVDTAQGDIAAESAGESANAQADAPKANAMPAMAGMGKMKFPAEKDMKFKDDVESNAPTPKNIADLTFTSKSGDAIRLRDFIGKKNIILVFTEGFDGMLCPFCKAQTSRLVANYEKFRQRDCEVIVVYPGPADHLEEFIQAATSTEKDQVDQVPFPIVLDKEFKATNYFNIHSKHAHPSTYIIDKNGGVQFAYVGQDMSADRPSISAMIKKLDNIEDK